MEAQKPSVGRVVHYVAYGTPGGEFPAGICRAAIVTEVEKLGKGGPDAAKMPDVWVASLCVLNPTGQFFNRHLFHDEDGKKPGTWHFPERVE